jgi:Tol biopolymer transport system component
MTIDFDIPHAQARANLHTGRRHLSGGEAKQLDAHLAQCAECRAYAAHLATAEPALAAALHARWDAAQPAQPEREFVGQVRARAGFDRPPRPAWLAAAPLTAGVALLVLVILWIGSGWGSRGAGPQPTEVVVVETLPLYEATAMPLGPTGPIIFSGLTGPSADTHWGVYAWPAARDEPLINLTPYAQQTYGGTWSPDGQWIALIGREFSGLEVFVMRADGSGLRKVSPPSDADWEYMPPLSWSPDGQTVAVARAPVGSSVPVSIGQSEIILLAADGSGSRPLVAGYSPKWSPDGAKMAFVRRPQLEGGTYLFTIQTDGTGERQVGEFYLAQGEFDWSPNSSQLAFTAIDPTQKERGPTIGLYLAAADSSQVEQLLALNTNVYYSTLLHWSPVGDYLLFNASLRAADLKQQPGLYLFSFATRQVTLALPNVLGDFSWSPDGRYFVATDTGSHSLYQFALQPDGSPVLAATVPVPDINIIDPQWQPAGPALVLPLPTLEPTAVSLFTPDLPADLMTRWLAFLVRNADNEDEIYLMRDKPQHWGALGSTGHGLAWSPDGTRLAFVSDRSGRPRVYLFDPEQWQTTPLTLEDAEQPALDFSLAWSPDGKWLAVTALPVDRGPEWAGGEVYLLDQRSALGRFPADAPRLARRVTERAVWSPDGAWLAYGGLDANGLPALFAVAVPADPTALDPQTDLPVQQLTASAAAPDGPHDIYLGYAWSPNSTRLAYLRQGPWVGTLLDSVVGEGFHSSIELVSLVAEPGTPATTLLDLAPSPNGITGLSWSPDGAYLLYLSDSVVSSCWNPWLLPAAGGEPVRLAGVCYLTRTALPQWSADSRYLLLTTETGPAVVDVPAALADPAYVTAMPLPMPSELGGLAHSPAWQPVP